jgi:cyclic pyranopterin phosphate synthase
LILFPVKTGCNWHVDDYRGDRLSELTHFNEQGHVHMVDVSAKDVTCRTARASCEVQMLPETLRRIKENGFNKGNVVEVARLAGIMATKRTSDIIPLCHPLSIDSVEVSFEFLGDAKIRIISTVKATDRTGVEMEALTAVTAAGLVVYDMCKSVDRSMKINNIQLEEKTGGKSGDFRRC